MAFRLLVLTPYASRDDFRELQAGRLLLDALDRDGVEATLHQPWLPRPDLDRFLERFDVAVGWHYRHTRHNHLFYCRALERRCAEVGLPVVNPAGAFDHRHSSTLEAWRRAGVPCAAHQRFRSFEAIALDYPLILRRDGAHRGLYMFKVDDEARARHLVATVRTRQSGAPLDLALAFVDARWPDGFVRKRRCYVVSGNSDEDEPRDDQVIAAHALRAEDWRVHFGSVEGTAAAFREHRAYVRAGEPHPARLRAAAAALGVAWAAIDYSPLADGGYVFWEANRNPLMWGDPGYPRARPRPPERRFVAAIVARLAAAAAGAARPSR